MDGYGQNIFMHEPGHEHFIPTKFRKHPLSGSVVKAGYKYALNKGIHVDTVIKQCINLITYTYMLKLMLSVRAISVNNRGHQGTMLRELY